MLEQIKKDADKIEKKDYDSLIQQIKDEYQIAYDFLKPKRDEWGVRLKLYNNQKKDKEAVGEPLLFTIHQTVLASLYEDKLTVKFQPRERGDIDVAENLTVLAEFDYTDMEKDKLDYAWDWDATFFGRGFCYMNYFNRELKIPIPSVINPMTFLVDPRATSINGNDLLGTGRARFCGWESTMTKSEMKDSKVYKNIDELTTDGDSDSRSISFEDKRLRNEAQNVNELRYQEVENDNKEYKVLKWFTVWNGKRVYAEIANQRDLVIRFIDKFSNLDIPIIDRQIYPISHDWFGVSIPDLIEDKQRAKAVAINLSLQNAKNNLNKRYMYDVNKVDNSNDLNYQLGKHIRVKGPINGTIAPVPDAQVGREVDWIMSVLDASAQKATATPDIQQGAISGAQRTASEINEISRGVDTRYSLSAKIFGWSEKRFWKQWYSLYKRDFKDGIDEKVIRLAGSMRDWRELGRDNIIAKTDPDIVIESEVMSEVKRIKQLQAMSNFIGVALQHPGTNQTNLIRKLGVMSGLTNEDVKYLVPQTIDEMAAEKENIELMKDAKRVDVHETDDHIAHMEIHNKLPDDNKYKKAHINAHKNMMLVKKKKEQREYDKNVNNKQQEAQQAQQGDAASSRITGAINNPTNRLDGLDRNTLTK